MPQALRSVVNLIKTSPKRAILVALNRLIPGSRYVIATAGLSYFKSSDVIVNARKRGLEVCEYLEETDLGRVGRRRDLIVERLLAPENLVCGERILEIGAGTCMFLEKMVKACGAKCVEIYETDPGWRSYAQQHLAAMVDTIILHDADGRTLSGTGTSSVDLVYAHGVFVYVPFVTTWSYLQEVSRVLRPGGCFVFDAFLLNGQIEQVITTFRQHNSSAATFPVFLHRHWIEQACCHFGFQKISSFKAPYHGIESTYFVLRKQ